MHERENYDLSVRRCLAAFTASAVVATISLPEKTVANELKPLDTFRDCEACPEMVVLPLGEFLMGAPADEGRRAFVWNGARNAPVNRANPYLKMDDGPMVKVVVDTPFAIGLTEVTNTQWLACVNDGGCNEYVPERVLKSVSARSVVSAGDEHPVAHVSFSDQISYIEWLNGKAGAEAYRLPTEAEWEYAARAGTRTRFSQGDDLTSDQANFSRGSTEHFEGRIRNDLVDRSITVPVGTLDAANDWGLRHMSGNVMELTQSCWTARLPALTSTSDWIDASSMDECKRATRGGAFTSPLDGIRVAWRGSRDQNRRTQNTGFRVVKQLEGID